MSQHELLPLYGFKDDLNPPIFEPAGTDAEQIAMDHRCRSLLEAWHDGFALSYRFTRSVLTQLGWRVLLLPHGVGPEEEDAVRLDGAIMAGNRHLLGFGIEPGLTPGRVWRVPALSGMAFRFTGAMTPAALFAMVLPEDWSRAFVQQSNDYDLLAGPESFLRAAVGDIGRAHRDFERDRAAEERMGRPRWLLDLVEHYEPFLLRE